MRYLPITADSGWRERATLWALCYIVFPEDEQDAIRAANCLSSENDAMEAGFQDGYGVIGNAVQKEIQRRILMARLCGSVFYQMLLNMKNRGEPGYRKALFAVSEWASVTKTKNGRPLPSDGDRLRKEFNKFSSSLHYWAAFELLDSEDQVFSLEFDSAFQKWMVTASEIQSLAFNLGVSDKAIPLNDWNPWLVPKYFSDPHKKDFSVFLPDENSEIRERLGRYRWKPFENPSR